MLTAIRYIMFNYEKKLFKIISTLGINYFPKSHRGLNDLLGT